MKTRVPILAGNWKMHLTIAEATALAAQLRAGCPGIEGRDVIVAPVFTALAAVAATLAGSPIRVAAQDSHWKEKGAYTGEVSGSLLKDAGCSAVIIGHSERRQFFGETDEQVNQKTVAALRNGLLPIVCVGETLAERESLAVQQVIGRQVREALEGLTPDQVGTLALAYEPIWAIGTGRTASPSQANEVHSFIRGLLSELVGATVAGRVRILYGGSVKPDNVDELMREHELDGVLVGGAALEAASFLRIVNFRA